MTAQRSELIRQVADIVDFQPERFDMGWFQQDGDCGAKACIAGHIGELSHDRFADKRSGFMEWYDRQSENIGLDPWAGEFLFTDEKMMAMANGSISQTLRRLAKEIAELEEDETISENDIARIADEIIAEKEEAAVAA